MILRSANPAPHPVVCGVHGITGSHSLSQSLTVPLRSAHTEYPDHPHVLINGVVACVDGTDVSVGGDDRGSQFPTSSQTRLASQRPLWMDEF